VTPGPPQKKSPRKPSGSPPLERPERAPAPTTGWLNTFHRPDTGGHSPGRAVIDRVLQGGPVLIDCGPNWCQPCKPASSPISKRLANEAAGQWILAKVDNGRPTRASPRQLRCRASGPERLTPVIGRGSSFRGFQGALPRDRRWREFRGAAVLKKPPRRPTSTGGAARPRKGSDEAEGPPDPRSTAADKGRWAER